MKYRLLSIAEADLADTARWFKAQGTDLGQEFLDEFEAVMQRIMRFPDAWTRIAPDRR